MPNLDLVPEVYYNPNDPYHHTYDNKPLHNIIIRQQAINSVVDRHNLEIGNAAGTAGSIYARLAASIEEDGTLRTSAIDAALHSISEHTDETDQSAFLQVSDQFIRFTEREREKLELVEDEANQIDFNFETASPSSTPVEFSSGTVVLADSLSTAWRYQAGKMYLDLQFSLSALHLHYYDIEPEYDTGGTQYKDYKIPTYPDYIDGSLKVYINGFRLSEDESVYHPGPAPDEDWTLNDFTSDASNGKFSLTNAITANDVIRIDFERSIT